MLFVFSVVESIWKTTSLRALLVKSLQSE